MFHFFKKNTQDASQSEQIAMSALLKLMEENDILEIELLTDGKILKIGVSSDYDRRRKQDFFDKRYYIGDMEYPSPADFSRAFAAISSQTMQTVLRIDGVAPKHYYFER